MVTSSAVVGSSRIRKSGSAASAPAINARWRMPPGQLVRIGVGDRCGLGDTHLAQQFDGARQGCRSCEKPL